ncbi:MAG: YigZ family protein [Synergistaceae bacterium]|nr:YigZ family protein [Synergistaceae bacterium]
MIFYEPAQAVTYEEKIKRSVFIANLEPCRNFDEAKIFLSKIISNHRDATHNCRAYILSDLQEYSSDDGEPSGTAGKPILNAIKRSGLVNVMIIVTRYFGGVKLGTRGLIDAYGGTAEKALALAGRVEKILTAPIKISLPYNSMGSISKILEASGAQNLNWNYQEAVNVIANIPADSLEKIFGELEELKARKIIFEWEKISS